MANIVLVQMWGPIRKQFISSHRFYVEQGKKKLLSQFENMEEEADNFANEWLNENSQYFDPDLHDDAYFYERAEDESNDFYLNLLDLKDQTRFALIAGMYHKWDKQLRDWLILETKFLKCYTVLKSKIWNVNLGNIIDFFDGLGWNIRKEKFFSKIDACRLIVNVYKHGNGNSFDELLLKYPEYVVNPLPGLDTAYLDYENVVLTDQHLQEFSDAIIEFWKTVPENFFISKFSGYPHWIEKELKKNK